MSKNFQSYYFRTKVLFFALVLIASGCGSAKEPELKNMPELSIPASSQDAFNNGIQFEGESGGYQIVSFTATSNWIASFSQTKAFNGWLTVSPDAGGPGKATITISTTPNEAYSERFATITFKSGTMTKSVTVRQSGLTFVDVIDVTVTPSDMSMEIDETSQLVASVSPSNASDPSVTWSCSTPSVVTVDAFGMVTAVSEGIATIMAKAGEKTGTCNITVRKKVVDVVEVALNKITIDMIKGASETLSAMVKPDNATDKSVIWTSSNKDVATVDQLGKVTAVGGGTAEITAKAGAKEAKCVIKVTVPVENVSINQSSVELEEEQSITLYATVEPFDATDKSVTWSSSNVSAATVDANGKVTAVGEGYSTITAKAGSKSAVCKVTVKKKYVEVRDIYLNKTMLNLVKGATEKLIATIEPSDATNQTITWSSTNEFVAIVDQEGNVKAVGSGIAWISAWDKGQRHVVNCQVLVTTPVERVSLNHTSVSLNVGDVIVLDATVFPEDADDKSVEWSSSDASVASVNNNGRIVAVKEGETNITVTASGKEATCKVIVTVPVTSIELNSYIVTLHPNETFQLTASFLPDNATNKKAKWISSDNSVASVSDNGMVTAIKKGDVTITASADDAYAVCYIYVVVDPNSGHEGTGYESWD